MDEHLTDLEQRLDALDKKIEVRFKLMEDRFDQRFKSLEDAFAKLTEVVTNSQRPQGREDDQTMLEGRTTNAPDEQKQLNKLFEDTHFLVLEHSDDDDPKHDFNCDDSDPAPADGRSTSELGNNNTSKPLNFTPKLECTKFELSTIFVPELFDESPKKGKSECDIEEYVRIDDVDGTTNEADVKKGEEMDFGRKNNSGTKLFCVSRPCREGTGWLWMIVEMNGLVFDPGGEMVREPARVLVIGAAGQVGYALVQMIVREIMLGVDQHVILHMLDIPPAAELCMVGLTAGTVQGVLSNLVAAHARWLNAVCPNPIIQTTNDIDFGGENNFPVNIEGIQHPLPLEISLKASLDLAETKSYDISNKTLESDSGQSDLPEPIDIKIKCGTRVIVISGPNTGGKTASIKTLGLASVMLKAGMYLPAKNRPSLPWFDLVHADIGDHQYVEQSLSTFSGHLSWLCKILEVASKESLILIDEIGSGTDPSKGVALSASILHYLQDRVNLVVVTIPTVSNTGVVEDRFLLFFKAKFPDFNP